jgi:hypothetical protein
VGAEEVEQSVGLRAAGSEVNVGDKQSAKAPLGALFAYRVTSHVTNLTYSNDGEMTND